MKYLLSMDGGGSKTAWLMTLENGRTVVFYTTGGCSHPQMGVHSVLELIQAGISEMTKRAGCTKEDILCAAFGIPCYGEYPEIDKVINSLIKQLLPDAAVTICNDVELGFAGSLCLEDGIHLVAGTGAIAYGRNPNGFTARSNGWHPYFSDEGSGYWLGMQTLSLFTKQADQRVPRSALYSFIKQRLCLKNDQEILIYFDNILAGDRRKIASMQLYLKEAAMAGDASAIHLYESAAYELYLSIRSVYHALSFSPEDHIKVSYSGGLFTDGNFILKPLNQLMDQLPAILTPPLLPPAYGGILLAMQGMSYKKAKIFAKSLIMEFHKEEKNGNN